MFSVDDSTVGLSQVKTPSFRTGEAMAPPATRAETAAATTVFVPFT